MSKSNDLYMSELEKAHAMIARLVDVLDFWLPYIEGHFEGRSDEFDKEVDKMRDIVTKAKGQ